MVLNHPNEVYMKMAIKEARKAFVEGQYPLGAVVVLDGKVLSICHTTLHEGNDPSAHAEMNAIRKAARRAGSRYLKAAWLYTTLEPCPMCASVAIWAKMAGIVYGSSKEDALKVYRKQKDKKFSWRQINVSSEYIIKKGDPKLMLYKRFLHKDCAKLLALTCQK